MSDPSSSTENSAIPNGTSMHATHGGGLRSHLAHLRPKHALFRVSLNIHQVSSIPYVHGEFGVKWRFKNVVSAGPSSGLFAKIRAHRTTSGNSLKGKERAVEGPDILVHRDGGEYNENGDGDESPIDEGRRSFESGTRYRGHESYTDLLKTDMAARHAPSPSPMSSPDESQSSFAYTDAYSAARGLTRYLPLHDHSVKWEHVVSLVVQMDVHRQTLDLLPSELKLVVKQRVIPGDPESPQNPRLGHVLLNMAEYADAGPVTRNYLLRQSKTNAVLKLTIELEHVGGEKEYKAPPLRKGEILAGVAGLLSNDAYRSPDWLHRTLDLYGEHGDDAALSPQSPSTGVPFNLSQLPSAYGPRTTETLIEAIFNPVPTSSTTPSPFTYYVPPGGKDENEEAASADTSSGTLDSNVSVSEKQSMVSAESAATSAASGRESSTSEYSESGSGSSVGRYRGWWQKIGGSRPGTPSHRPTADRPAIVTSRTDSDGIVRVHGA